VISRRANGAFEGVLFFMRVADVCPLVLVEGYETFEQIGFEGFGRNGFELVDRIGHISYNFVQEKGYFKTVHFYLLRHGCGFVDKNYSEARAYRVEWFCISGAPRILLILRRIMS